VLRVRALAAGEQVPAGEYEWAVYADDRGSYRLYGLAAGAYVV
jgi:hypothetical protein